jgi:hypothetical protein
MSDRTVILIATAVLAASVAAAAAVGGMASQQRDALDLVVKMDGVEGMPPHVAVITAALGTFRGLAVDILWARADHLQTEGEFYEAQTLSQWITTLQPRFQKVWAFQAWNMAWNITAATQVPAERWGWVSRGIELLRTRGIPLNPKAANLYFELAYIFQNKIGRVGDKEHWYYKARLAREMQEVLGDLTGGKTAAEAVARFRRISVVCSQRGGRRSSDALPKQSDCSERWPSRPGRASRRGNPAKRAIRWSPPAAPDARVKPRPTAPRSFHRSPSAARSP